MDRIKELKLEIEIKEQMLKEIQHDSKVLDIFMFIATIIFMFILACSGGL